MIWDCDDGCQCGQTPCRTNNPDWYVGHGHPGGIAGNEISQQNTTGREMRVLAATPFFVLGGLLLLLAERIVGREFWAWFWSTE